jgi:hypothetical protein
LYGRRRREPGADNQQWDRETVREHDRFGAAVAAGIERF